jgi:hypothetical protein
MKKAAAAAPMLSRNRVSIAVESNFFFHESLGDSIPAPKGGD